MAGREKAEERSDEQSLPGSKNMEGSKELSELEIASLSLTKDRDLAEYEKCLHFTDQDIEGKRVLDLGSGPNVTFAKEVSVKLPGTKVVSLDFDFNRARRSEFGLENTRGDREESTHDLQREEGLFTKLPFRSGSFDVVVSFGAMPLYLDTPDRIREGFQEVVRVLKSGGKAFIGPITYSEVIDTDPSKTIWETHRKHSFEESEKLFKKILKKMKRRVKFEFVPAETRRKMGWSEIEERVVRPAALILTGK